jgi:hypothetical protein
MRDIRSNLGTTGKTGKTGDTENKGPESPGERPGKVREYPTIGAIETLSESRRMALRESARKLRLLKCLSWQAYAVRIREDHEFKGNTLWEILDTLYKTFKGVIK